MRTPLRWLFLAPLLAAAVACTCEEPPYLRMRVALPEGVGLCASPTVSWERLRAEHDAYPDDVRMDCVLATMAAPCNRTTGEALPGFCAGSVAAFADRCAARVGAIAAGNFTDAEGCVVPSYVWGGPDAIAFDPEDLRGFGYLVATLRPTRPDARQVWALRCVGGDSELPCAYSHPPATGRVCLLDPRYLVPGEVCILSVYNGFTLAERTFRCPPMVLEAPAVSRSPGDDTVFADEARIRVSVLAAEGEEYRLWSWGTNTLTRILIRDWTRWTETETDWVPRVADVWSLLVEARYNVSSGRGIPLAAGTAPLYVVRRETPPETLLGRLGALVAAVSSSSRLEDVSELGAFATEIVRRVPSRTIVDAVVPALEVARAARADAVTFASLLTALGRAVDPTYPVVRHTNETVLGLRNLERGLAYRSERSIPPFFQKWDYASWIRGASYTDEPSGLEDVPISPFSDSPFNVTCANIGDGLRKEKELTVVVMEHLYWPYRADRFLSANPLSFSLFDANRTRIEANVGTFVLSLGASLEGSCAMYDFETREWSTRECTTTFSVGFTRCTCTCTGTVSVVRFAPTPPSTPTPPAPTPTATATATPSPRPTPASPPPDEAPGSEPAGLSTTAIVAIAASACGTALLAGGALVAYARTRARAVSAVPRSSVAYVRAFA